MFSILLPNTEYGLRIFPLLCFWAAIYFFYKTIKKRWDNVYVVIVALSFFVLNGAFIYYSSEVKQYIGDVFVLTAIFYFLLKDYSKEKNKYYTLGIAGVVSIFLSNVAPIILSTAGIYMLYTCFFVEKQKQIRSLFSVFVIWLGAFSVYYYFFIEGHPSREFMVGFWAGQEDAFLPHSSLEDICRFLSIKRARIFDILIPGFIAITPLFEFIAQMILLLSLFAGLLSLILKKKIGVIILTCTPVILHLVLSAFQLYPFATRLVLYLLPCIIVICSFGVVFMAKIVFSRLKMEKYRLLGVCFPIFFLVGYPLKVEHQEIKASLKYIQENKNDNSNIYIDAVCPKVVDYYKAMGFVKLNYKMMPAIEDNVEMAELRKLRGENWLLFGGLCDEEKYLIERMDSLGYKKIKAFKAKSSSAYLYDCGK
jgi:hypothetical protein